LRLALGCCWQCSTGKLRHSISKAQAGLHPAHKGNPVLVFGLTLTAEPPFGCAVQPICATALGAWTRPFMARDFAELAVALDQLGKADALGLLNQGVRNNCAHA